MLIMAFDPGETTGWAAYGLNYSVGELDSSRMGLYTHLHDHNPDVIIYENFKQRPGLMKAELYSVQMISVIELYCEMRGITPALTPLPAEAKAFWTDDKIKALGLWTKGSKHAMDALRVLLLYREKTDKNWFANALLKLRQL